jgi:eukaryotic-like serine/threonine-protein kinase
MPTLLQRLPNTPAPVHRQPGTAGGVSAARTTAPTALAPTGWDADLLAPVERALAGVVGPLARLMVKQAARDAGDLAGLTEALLHQIADPADRSRFLARLESSTTHLTRGTTGTTARTASSAAAAAAAVPLSDAVREHATRVLTRHLGPIARVLVRKAAATAHDPQQFHQQLADMADGVDRALLLRELGASSG